MPSKLFKPNQSVEKVLQIIECLAQAGEPMRLNDLSRNVDMPDSTVLRIVNTLVQKGYAYQEENTHRYALTLRFSSIGQLVSNTLQIRDIVKPYLKQLSSQSGESACLAIEEEMEVIYIDVEDGVDGMLKIMQRIGKRAPLHATGVGKLFLTQYPPEKLQRLVQEKGLSALTKHTLTTLDGLQKAIQTIKAQGYAMDDEECELGARCVAAPLYNYDNKVIAAISITGPSMRLNNEKLERLKKLILETSQTISMQLGYNPA